MDEDAGRVLCGILFWFFFFVFFPFFPFQFFPIFFPAVLFFFLVAMSQFYLYHILQGSVGVIHFECCFVVAKPVAIGRLSLPTD